MAHDLLTDLKQSRPYQSLTQEAYIAVARTAAVLAHAFEETLKPFGITATQYNVLRILRGAEPDGLCRAEIRHRMVTAVPDVTRLLDRLEDMALIARARGVDDRRQMTARITRDGVRMLERVDRPVLERHDTLMADLSEQDLRVLLQLLETIRKHC